MIDLLLVFGDVDPGSGRIWPGCSLSRRLLAKDVMQWPLVCQNMFASLMIVRSADDRGVPMTTVSRWAVGPGGRSDWSLVQLQGAGLMAPPMNMLGHINVSSWRDGELYISSVFLWWTSLGTSLVTGSLLCATPVRSGTILCLPRVSTDLLQWTVDSISRITSGARLVNGMATGTGQPEANRAGGDLPVRVHVPEVLGGGGGGRDIRLSRTL